MSKGKPCKGCKPRKVEVIARRSVKTRGGRTVPSRYSTVRCTSCGKMWRTLGNVSASPDASGWTG